MNMQKKFAGMEVGYDVPALPGMSFDEIQTPCLILDLDALRLRRARRRKRFHGEDDDLFVQHLVVL